jgi:two-component system sensor histidine kinase/response regulator
MPPSQTVLVVEDDCNCRLMVQAVLQDEGYEVGCAANGCEAIEYLRKAGPVGLILLDLNMPVMGGFEFREWQLATLRFAKIPVILFSGHHNLARIAESLEVSGFFAKPFDFDVLLDAVQGAVRATATV